MFRETHAISAIASSTKNRMREKAVVGDDGSQVSRKGLLAVVRTNLERLEPMPFRAQLQDTSRNSTSGCEQSHSLPPSSLKKLTYMLIHTYVNFTIHILFLSTLHIIFEKRRLL